MSRPLKRKLSKVAIGPYIPNDNMRNPVIITSPKVDTSNGALYDLRMGYINTSNSQACTQDQAECFGRMGYIPITGGVIINPVMEKNMTAFLHLFRYDGTRLVFKDGILDAIRANRSLQGHRRFRAISDMIGDTGGKWVLNAEIGGVTFVAGKKTEISIPGIQLRKLLEAVTSKYSANNPVAPDISLEEIGINTNVARPEDWMMGYIPVLPNTARLPPNQKYTNATEHPYTRMYSEIFNAAATGNLSVLRDYYLNLISNGEVNLTDTVFSSKKRAFVRGAMLAKVCGNIMRDVITPNLELKPYQVGIPKKLSRQVSQRVLVTAENINQVRELVAEGHITHVFHIDTKEYIKISKQSSFDLKPGKSLVIRELQDGDVVLLNRQPSLHKNSILALEVVTHNRDTIEIHDAVSKGFGADYDGDEVNVYIPYADLAVREARELMFVTYHMASLASSSLLVGYHQDVNLGAHMLSMDVMFLTTMQWDILSRISYEFRWKEKYSYEEWSQSFRDKASALNVEPYSGRALYSTLLPEDMEWSMNGAVIKKGILVSGLLDSKSTSGSPNSIGMVIYRTYGPKECIEWLNASYRMLSVFLVEHGITLGITDIIPKQRDHIDSVIATTLDRKDLSLKPDTKDSILDARRENFIMQELGNVRDRVGVIIMDPRDVGLAKIIRGTVMGSIVLTKSEYTLYPKCEPNMLCLYTEPNLPKHEKGYMIVTIPASGSAITLDYYSGYIQLEHTDGNTYRLSMAIFPEIDVTLEDGTQVNRVYKMPNPLNMMITSGARGNSTNAIQVTGLIGQLAYGGGRIPDSMPQPMTPRQVLDTLRTKRKIISGTRSMPSFKGGDNSPKARGFVAESYVRGITPSNYMAVHIASRENLTANIDLTPRTGYFERRLRTFTENLVIKRVMGRQVVVNERGVFAMYDYMLDPSRIFKIQNKTTFVDVAYEMRRVSKRYTKTAIYIHVPFRENMRDYVNLDERLRANIAMFPNVNVLLVCDHRVQIVHPDYYEYLTEILPSEIKRDIIVISPNGTVHENKRLHWFFALEETYTQIVVIPMRSRVREQSLVNLNTPLPEGVIAAINVSSAPLTGISHSVRRGSIIPESTLYDMLTLGTNFSEFPMVIRPNKSMYEMLENMTLLQALIVSGDIKAL